MIDFHTHILPGFDDGSPDLPCSRAMLQREQDQGCEGVCLTSHYYPNESIEDFCLRRAQAFQALQTGLGEQDQSFPPLFLGAETAYFSGIAGCKDISRLCLENTNTLLLELPFASWQDFEIDEVISLALDRNLRLVLVHPERFMHHRGNEQKLQKLLQLPIGLQINAGSLLNPLGRKVALELLRSTPFPLLGSDCHNLTTRTPNLAQGRQVVQKKLGTEFLEQIDFAEQHFLCSKGEHRGT